MGDAPFIKFYSSDFLGGTSGLSPAERGVYITLLCLMFEDDGPIVRDDARLSRRCGAPKATFTRILAALIEVGKITESGGRLSNRRAMEAIIDRRIRSRNGTHAATERWEAQRQNSEQNQGSIDTPAMPTQCVSDASQSQSQNKEEEEDTRARETDDLLSQVMAAVGLNSGAIPSYWLPPAASIHVERWRSQLGLTAEEIVAAARASRQRHPEPPGGPKALDRVMRTLATEKAAAPLIPITPPLETERPHARRSASRGEEKQAAYIEAIKRAARS